MELGDKCKDRISGFIGVAVARYAYLNGCSRIALQPVVDKDGKLPDLATFDEPQLEVVETKFVEQGDTSTGGPDKYLDTRRY